MPTATSAAARSSRWLAQRRRPDAHRLEVDQVVALVAEVGGADEHEAGHSEHEREERRHRQHVEQPARQRLGREAVLDGVLRGHLQRRERPAAERGRRPVPRSPGGTPSQISVGVPAPGSSELSAVARSPSSAMTNDPPAVGKRRATADDAHGQRLDPLDRHVEDVVAAGERGQVGARDDGDGLPVGRLDGAAGGR